MEKSIPHSVNNSCVFQKKKLSINFKGSVKWVIWKNFEFKSLFDSAQIELLIRKKKLKKRENFTGLDRSSCSYSPWSCQHMVRRVGLSAIDLPDHQSAREEPCGKGRSWDTLNAPPSRKLKIKRMSFTILLPFILFRYGFTHTN